MSEFTNVSALQSALDSGLISSEDIVNNYLKKITALDPQINAFVEVYAKEARDEAKSLDEMRKNGIKLSPLHGIPIAVKDLIDVKGKKTTAGSPLRHEIAIKSAQVVDLLRKAGLIVIGKTHTVQFALGAWGNNEHMGTPKNPWDLKKHLTPGGSSSGSAVAVASGMVPLSLGTDTGGSIRIPASFCSITGMKTTIKRISLKGVVPLSRSLDTLGMFAKDAAPLVDLFKILSPTDDQPIDVDKSKDYALNKLRIGRLHKDDLHGVHPDILSAYEAFISKITTHGVRIETIKMPFTFETVAKVLSAIMLTEAAVEYADLAKDSSKAVDPSVRPILIAGTLITGAEYVKALRAQESMKEIFTQTITNLDAFITPASMCTAMPIAQVNHDRPPVRYSRLLNLLDLCGISIPIGMGQNGLPIGLQIGGRAGEDEKIMLIAKEIQSVTNDHVSYPPGMQFF